MRCSLSSTPQAECLKQKSREWKATPPVHTDFNSLVTRGDDVAYEFLSLVSDAVLPEGDLIAGVFLVCQSFWRVAPTTPPVQTYFSNLD